MHSFIGRGLTVAVIGLAALFAGCGGDGDGSESTTAATAVSGGGASVAVTLTEWGVAAGAESVAAGDVTFVVSNEGSVPHELVVIRTDLAADALPTSGGLVDEGQVDVAGRTAQLGGGKSAELSVTIAAGSYALVCNVPAHYDLGMRIAFRVQ